ncbi:hypothetical protein ABFX02_13G027100 [Erythranthe guttata]
MSDFIPTDILIEILLKLPVKSLIRFTTVAKSWRSIITTPTFIDSHISGGGGNNHTLLLRRYDKSDKLEHYSLLKTTKGESFSASSSSQLEFPFKSQNGYFRIVGSCDGLVCLLDDLFVNCSSPIVIWNPSVRNHIVLPNPSINPKEVPHIAALGFGGVAGDVYKVVRLVYCRKTEDFGFVVPPLVEIYSVGTGKWKKISGVDVRLRVLEYMWNQAFLNGVVHWLAYEPIDENKTTRGSILSFHMGEEVFGEVALPDELASESVTSFCIFVIGESLGIVKYDGEATRQSCDVWFMKEYGVKESWIKLYRIGMLEHLEKVVGFLESGEALLALMNIGLVAYNPFTMLTTDLGIDGAPRSFYVDNYSESLLLLKGHVVGAAEEESSVRRIEN